MAKVHDRRQVDDGLSRSATPRDHLADDLRDRQTGRSNFVAFLVGGAVIAGGMSAFLYYDAGMASTQHDDLTTGSLLKLDTIRPATAPNISIPSRVVPGLEPKAGR